MTTVIDAPSVTTKVLQGSLSGGRDDPWTEDTPSVGVSRRRARYTRTIKQWQFTLRLTATEWATLETFYETTLSHGVLSFNWSHPISSTSYEVQFVTAPAEKHVAVDLYDISVSVSQV